MPRYDYECENGHQQEMVHGMRETPSIACEACWQPMRRVFSGGSNIYTPKDKAYEFTTTHVQPGTEIRTKGQWERLLRRNKLTDDVGPKEAMQMTMSDKAAKLSKERRAATVKRAAKLMMDSGYKEGMPGVL